ncbi:hypothetical protein SNE40_015884 [Patella caerulea]|uniref:Peroxin-19 n=2 Tax=Patella caerulea TaxID=87958 RepID=A0AAN8JBZ9_PATCE
MADDGDHVASKEDTSSKKDNLNTNNASVKDVGDPELDQLLDSALEDFDKQATPEVKKEASNESTRSASDGAGPAASEDAMADEFSEQMAAQFEEAMKAFMSQDPSMVQQLEKLSEVAGKAGESAEAQQEFATTLSQTLSGLAQNAEGLQEEMSEEDLNQAFANMGVGAMGPSDGQEGPDYFPMMQGMMQMLLSKEVLYPSLKEISSKYPKWLDENKDKIVEEERNRFNKQHTLMVEICSHYESEQETDSDDVKRERFENLMTIMQQMQELGQPPKDIVGDMAPGLEFDENGLPKLPGMASSCSIM